MATQDIIPFRIVSAIPGRARIRFGGKLRREGQLVRVAAHLSTLPAVRQTSVVTDANSVIVYYGKARPDLATLVREVEKAAAAIGIGSLPSDTARPVRPRNVSPSQGVSILHWFPGRLRVRIPRLHRHREAASHLERELEQQHGIHSVEAQPDEEFVVIRYDADVHHPAGLVESVERLFALAVQSPPGHVEITRARDIPLAEPQGLNPLLLPTMAVGAAMTGAVPSLIVGSALALAALPLAGRALEGARARHFNVDQLDLSALLVLASRGDFRTAGLMTWLIGLGDLIRAKTMRRSRRAMSELMSPAEQQAWIERDGRALSVPVNTLKPGDIVSVYPGDQIPVDGVVTRGKALVDQKALTGEPVPVSKEPADAVFALTVVVDGQISVRVEHLGNETRAGRVVEMIENAPLSDTRVQDYAAKLGDRLVVPIFGLAGAAYLMTGDPLRAAAILILDFATGIRVSAPTTILSAMMGAARQGLFIKGGKAMEKLAQVDAAVFDKTGTLTRGEPVVTSVHSFDLARTSDDVLRLAACAEANLKHPAAKAIVDAARARGLRITAPAGMDYALGLGVKTVVEGRTVHVGSERYLLQSGVETTQAAALTTGHTVSGSSLVYIAVEGLLTGLLAYTDPPRAESALVIRALLDRGVKRIVLLTGDNGRAAQAVAQELGITDVVAEAFPEHKAQVVQSLREQGHTVAVLGDGINDSPAFVQADVSISLQHGADVAKETADVILLDGDLRALPLAIDLSRQAMGVLRQNVNIVVAPTALGIAAAAFGLSTPLFSTLISNGTAALAGLNALRPLFARVSDRAPRPRLVLAEEPQHTQGRASSWSG